jgi:hypothetical protein
MADSTRSMHTAASELDGVARRVNREARRRQPSSEAVDTVRQG